MEVAEAMMIPAALNAIDLLIKGYDDDELSCIFVAFVILGLEE